MLSRHARQLRKSAVAGFVATAGFALLAIFVVPGVGYPVLFAPGAVLAILLGPAVEFVVRFAEVEGGPGLGVGLLLLGALVFWWLVFTAIIAVLRYESVA